MKRFSLATEPSRLVVQCSNESHQAPRPSSGRTPCGPLDVVITPMARPTGHGWEWHIENSGSGDVAVRSVALVFVLSTAGVRMLRHGYQSWSVTDVAAFGEASDPSRAQSEATPPLT